MSQQLSTSRIYNTIALNFFPLNKVVCHFVCLWIWGTVCETACLMKQRIRETVF